MNTRALSNVRKFGALACILIIVATISSHANAYTTYNDHRLSFGIANQKYWLATSAVNHNENAIVSGVDIWNNQSTVPFSYSRTYTQSQSRLDFYRQAQDDGNCSVTQFYVDTTTIDPNNQNWWWAKVTNRPALKVTAQCGSADHRKGIMAHEIGHAMGLGHTTWNEALMYWAIAINSTLNHPVKDDRNGINYLY